MGIILKLTLRYMRKNRKRTMAAVIAITGTMTILTAVNIFANTFTGMLIDNVIENEGSYHVIFHELSRKQCELLKQSEKVKVCTAITDCTECSGENTYCAKVEMVRADNWFSVRPSGWQKRLECPSCPGKSG